MAITGRVTENLTPVAGVTVQLMIGRRVVFRTRTRANGTYTFALRKRGRRSTTVFTARVSVPARSVTTVGCAVQIPNLPAAPAGCVSATASAWSASSRGRFRVTL